MKNLLTFLLIGIIPVIWAQPTISNAEDFSIGTVLKFQKINPTGISPGKAGANKTWNFS